MYKSRISIAAPIAALAAVLPAALPAAQQALKSGLAKGDVTVPFQPLHLSGPDKGARLCPV